jgi:SAM-dependent methyltransferase
MKETERYLTGDRGVPSRVLHRLGVRIPPVEKKRAEYERIRALFFLNTYRSLLRKIGKEFRSGQRVLEIGVGPGFLAAAFEEAGLKVFATEVCLPPPDCAFRGPLVLASPRQPLALPFGDESFDYVSLTSVLHHIPQELQRLWISEIKRILKPNGTLLIQEDERGKNPFEHTVIRAIDFAVSCREANSHRTLGQWKDFLSEYELELRAHKTVTHGMGPFSLNKIFMVFEKN